MYENLERFFQRKMILTGNPVRQDLIDIESKRVAAMRVF
jgi:UDP-N-acetylglucosamine--N-acetylmuramyl-(pentapeptide) pyrophosphoryl-undecaprenol N-acetylglucosamine transferase